MTAAYEEGKERQEGGFSLPELLVVLAIAAVMAGAALPDFRQMIRAQQLKAATYDLFGAIDLTRTQAIARGRRVQLVPFDAAGGDWSGGWVVFVDEDGDRRPGPGEEVIQRYRAPAKGIAVEAAFSSQQGASYLAYNSMGRSCSDTSSLAARFGTLSLVQGEHIRRIKINMLGRARLCDPARDGAGCAGPDP
ncbi:MAG: type-4 fimbrial pilin related signal peptide protein [Massilia sp.]|nr:type-4 fimbrial pilin related signal peptide protein [Massilia sp.]